jgi:hypothetical protein
MSLLPEYIKIDNNANLARHTSSMGVVNLDKQALSHYRIQKARILEEKKLLNNTIDQISELRSELDGLKQLVKTYMVA